MSPGATPLSSPKASAATSRARATVEQWAWQSMTVRSRSLAACRDAPVRVAGRQDPVSSAAADVSERRATWRPDTVSRATNAWGQLVEQSVSKC